MMDMQVSKYISSHDKDNLMSLLSLSNDSELLAYLLNTLILIIIEKKNMTSYIDNVISFCYEIIHEKREDYTAIYKIINKSINKINYRLTPYYQNKRKKDEIYTNGIHTLSRLRSYNDLIANISKNKNPNCEIELFWFLITKIKNYQYLNYLVSKNPSILNLKINNTNILIYYLKYYLLHINENNIYYDQVLYLLLESKYPRLKKGEYQNIISLIDSLENKDEKVLHLRRIISQYFNNNDKTNTSTYIKNSKDTFVFHKPWQIGSRTDFRSYRTISIDSDNRLKERTINYDDAFTLLKKDGHYMLYIHIADVPTYVQFDSESDYIIKKKLYGTNMCNGYHSLFENEFSHNYLSLVPNQERFTITLGIEIANDGTILNYQFHEGIIKNDQAYYYEEADMLLKNNNYELMSYKEVAEKVLNRKVNSSNDIIYAFNMLMGKVVGEHYLENNIPGIFRNCIKIKDTLSKEQINWINSYINNNISRIYLDKFIESSQNNQYAFYDTKNYGHSQLKCKAYVTVSRPIRSYIDIANLRGLKAMVIRKQAPSKDLDYYQEYYEDISLRANALDAVLKLTK